VIAKWIVPAVSSPVAAPSPVDDAWDFSSWIGIDGWTTNDVLQAGVRQTLYPNGTLEIAPWFEWFVDPNTLTEQQKKDYPYVYETDIMMFPVSVGDQLWVVCQYVDSPNPAVVPGIVGSIYMANETTGQHFQTIMAPPPTASMSGATVEWIVERFGLKEDASGNFILSVPPQYTSVQFTSAAGCGVGNSVANPAAGQNVTYDFAGVSETATVAGNYAVRVNQTGSWG
jgi:hypothetical protein